MGHYRRSLVSETTPKPSALDRPSARLAALGIFLCAALALAWVHRNGPTPPQAAAARAADDPAALCLAARAGNIDRMREDGVIDDDQAVLFKSRAEAWCVAQQGQGGPPRLPGNSGGWNRDSSDLVFSPRIPPISRRYRNRSGPFRYR